MKASWSIGSRVALIAVVAGLLYGAVLEFYNVAWGTGHWVGEFSLRWGSLFLAFVLLAILILLAAGAVAWKAKAAETFLSKLAQLRQRMGAGRWLLCMFVVVFPIWFLQYSPWGVVFSKPFIRLAIWCAEALFLAYLISSDPVRAWTWGGFLAGPLVSGAGFVLAVPFQQVTSYPFALGWSEGNRLWDYSLLFGSHLYTYPASSPPAAYLEPGRQFVGGLPFLLPHLSIVTERLWIAALDVLPYLILGWLAFRPARKQPGYAWILAGVWGFMFLTQGPIHAPLLVCAILVALAWGQPLWLAAFLVLLSGYFAEVSRYTWIFAPAMWAVMLEFSSSVLVLNRVTIPVWKRSVTVGVAGLMGSLVLPRVLDLLHLSPSAQGTAPGVAAGGVSLAGVTSAATSQPLLWYRLFPNATYGYGILIGVLIAAGPLMLTLLYLSNGLWKLTLLQKLAIALPLGAFLLVGLIISTKIGGGGDLHNLDMFLIGLLFAAALAWRSIGNHWSVQAPRPAWWVSGALLLAIGLPAFQPLMALRPISFAKDADWLMVLADAARAKDLGSLPASETADAELQKLRADVGAAQLQGEVLFMDQRQLLTFGYLADVELVSAYEKKQMMDEALSGNAAYFDAFYKDLAAHRFALIVSDPLRTPIKDSDYGFGEENNAWVKWVAKPVLCYYEEKDTLTNVRVELLVPRQGVTDCASELP